MTPDQERLLLTVAQVLCRLLKEGDRPRDLNDLDFINQVMRPLERRASSRSIPSQVESNPACTVRTFQCEADKRMGLTVALPLPNRFVDDVQFSIGPIGNMAEHRPIYLSRDMVANLFRFLQEPTRDE